MKDSKILHRSIYEEFLKVFDEINSKVLNNREHEEVICLFFVMSFCHVLSPRLSIVFMNYPAFN